VGVGPEQVVAGAGADDLIDVMLRVAQPESVVDVPPTFGMYGFSRRSTERAWSKLPGWKTSGPTFPRSRMPWGWGERGLPGVAEQPDWERALAVEVRELCELDAFIVIDEAYVEFGGRTVAPLLKDHSNLVILRTFSKWAG
jgi:histidinol-phosphate aminotransferase